MVLYRCQLGRPAKDLNEGLFHRPSYWKMAYILTFHKRQELHRDLLQISLNKQDPPNSTNLRKVKKIYGNLDRGFRVRRLWNYTTHPSNKLCELKSKINLPILLFPGNPSQISKEADGILFLTLLSGRNPEYFSTTLFC